MTSQPRIRRRFAVLAAGALMGSTFGLIPSCEGMLTTFNPCGTVLEFCQPYELDALFGDLPDYSLDPTCTIPFFGIYGDGTTTGGTTGGGFGGGGFGGGFGGGVSQGSCYGGVLPLKDLDL